MSALHWICALTLGLVCCLSAQPVKRNVVVKKEILRDLEFFKSIAEKNCSKETSPRYSPVQIQKECLHSALNCTILELKVLADECDTQETPDDYGVFNDLINGLDNKLKELPSSSPDCICEKNDEKDFKQFLDNIRDQVQQLP